MKTLYSLLIIFLTFNICHSQTESSKNDLAVLGGSDSFPQILVKDQLPLANEVSLKDKHNNIFVRQVSEFVADFVQYPAELLDYQIEGTVIVNLLINQYGEIQEYKIVDGLDSKIDSVVIMQFQQFSKIDIHEAEYHGNRSINVPVNFTIDN